MLLMNWYERFCFRSVKEQMSVMKEEFQQENFTLHERIATLEAQLLQSQQQVIQLQTESDARGQESVSWEGQGSMAGRDSTLMSLTNVTGPEYESSGSCRL